MFLSRNEIRATNDRKMQPVLAPEMGAGAQVMVRQMSGRDREIYEQWAMAYSEQRAMGGQVLPQDLYARMAVLSCVTEDGEPLFTLEDVDWLSQKSFVFLKRIFDVAWTLNLFAPEEVERAADFLDATPQRFWFRLALALGGRTVGELQAAMSSAEFVYWQAYSTIEPFGDARGDLQAAIIAQTVANRHRGAKEQAYKLADFLPQFTPRRRMASAEAQKEFFRKMTLAVGGQVISKRGGEA